MLKGEHLERPTYRFLHTLDEGNTARCVLTEHEIFGCQVVQKSVSMLGMKDTVAATEPELLKRIEHDCIVRVWEAQWDPLPEWRSLGVITFTTPYYEGQSIYKAISEGHRFGVGDVVRVADRILQALDHMHVAHRLLHRDVKPGKIMLDRDRRDAYLGDLGSAAYIQTSTGGAQGHAGSPLYLAPEARAADLVTVRSDLYSLGVTLVEMLYGGFPYEDLVGATIDARLDEGRRALPDRYLQPGPWVPRPLATFLRSLSCADPAKRPESAAAALHTLRGLRLVDWKRADGDGLEGRWVGTWPPDKRRGQRRTHEVTIARVEQGKDRGRLKATARWRDPVGKWRGYPRLTRTVDWEAAAVGRYFRDVDAAAQSAPTR